MNLKILLVPFLLFFSAFIFDKFILLDSFPMYYLTTASFINFEHKEKLILELKEYLKQQKRKRVIVIMGNSRSMSFDNEYIAKTYPDWILFNFSVPGGTQDYFLYLMEKFKKFKIQPEAIFFAVTPQGMNKTPSVLTDEVMVFGLPVDFIARYWFHYRIDELTNYIGKKLFATYRFRPKIRIIKRRLNPEVMKDFQELLIKTSMVLEKERGSISPKVEFKPHVSEEILEKNANSIWKDFFIPFVFNYDSLFFLEECIKISKELRIKNIALFWPPVSPQLKHKKQYEKVAIVKNHHQKHKKTVNEVWIPRMKAIAQKYQIQWYDFNFDNPMECNYFADASHLASICYPEYTDKIFKHLGGKKQ